MGRLFDLEIALRAASQAAANNRARRTRDAGAPIDLCLCIVDHFEPQVGGARAEIAWRRLERWLNLYPVIADRHRDADGHVPPHGFFYPWDEYAEDEFVAIRDLCRRGYGEIEIHLHHRDDTEATLRAKMNEAISVYSSHGALSQWPDGRPAFAFIHGNWALDNSRTDGGRNYCGVNSEIRLLRDLGCYADFTFPAWQQTAQPRLTNTIYYAVDDPGRPKSHESGTPASVGAAEQGDLLLVQGPLQPYWMKSRGLVRPAVDDGDLASYRRYSPDRLDRWIAAGIHVQGNPHRIFVKLHCHGAADFNSVALLDSDLDALFSDAEQRYNDGNRYRLHYVTARELFNIVRATEIAPHLSVDAARSFLLHPPAKAIDQQADSLV